LANRPVGGLSETGYVEGQNVRVEYLWAEGFYNRLPTLASELVNGQVDVIVANGGVAIALAAKSATKVLPILFVIGVDPVSSGLVVSLNRPGENITGRFSGIPIRKKDRETPTRETGVGGQAGTTYETWRLLSESA
jgi:ABC-type uncharacterized transport system substrate-binding protein